MNTFEPPAPVSPADVIRRDFDLLQAQVGAPVGYETSQGPLGRIWRDRAALLAVGERDKAEIERLRDELAEKVGELAVAYGGNDRDGTQAQWFSALDREKAKVESLTFERERDRRQIARMEGAIRSYIAADAEHQRRIDTSMLAAVLADKEDADNG